MKAKEIREKWVEGANYGPDLAVRAEYAAQLAEIVRVAKVFVAIFAANAVANSDDPTYTAETMKVALGVIADSDTDTESEPDEPECCREENQCCRQPGANAPNPQQGTSWGTIAGSLDHTFAADPRFHECPACGKIVPNGQPCVG